MTKEQKRILFQFGFDRLLCPKWITYNSECFMCCCNGSEHGTTLDLEVIAETCPRRLTAIEKALSLWGEMNE